MTDEKRAADYGESDIEAKAMSQASKDKNAGKPPSEAERARTPPASGSTETDISANRAEKADRESKS